MSAQPWKPVADTELQTLVEELLNESLAPEGLAQLESRLSSDQAAQDYYLAYVDLRARLRWLARGNNPAAVGVPLSGTSLSSLRVPSAKASEPRIFLSDPKRTIGVLGFLGKVSSSVNRPVVCSILFVGVAFCGYFALIAWNLRSGSLPRGTAGNDSIVAQIVNTKDAQWNDPPAAISHQQSEIAVGEPLQIASGLVEMQLKQGTKLLIEGPAEWTIDGNNEATLKRGKLVANVPSHAIGFTLETPVATIVDHGTEFGVTADGTGKTEVQVFQGRVSVQPMVKFSNHRAAAMVLTAGQSGCVHLDEKSGELVMAELASADKLYTQELPPSTKPGRPKLPDSLVAYWSFDEEHGPVWDERGRNHGSLEKAERVAGIIGNGALKFSNTPGETVRIPARTSDLDFVEGVTIEVTLVSAWSAQKMDYDEIMRKEGNNRLLLSLQNDYQTAATFPKVAPGPALSFGTTVNGAYHELDMPLDGRDGRPTVADITDGEPHHIVATYSAATGKKALYVDGVLRFLVSYPPGSTMASSGTLPTSIGSIGPAATFNGILDELALYREPLSAEEIADHWKRVQSRQSYFAN